MKNRIKNERGDLSFFSIFIILAINMLLSFVLLYASVQINCINIRNAAKMELNNVSNNRDEDKKSKINIGNIIVSKEQGGICYVQRK